MTRRTAVLALGSAAVALTAPHQTHAAPDVVLGIGGAAPLGPGERPGFADSVVIEAFHRIGIVAEVIALPAERALINANLGIEDGDALRTATIEPYYRNLVRIPEPVLQFELNSYTHDTDLVISRWEDLHDLSVGILEGVKVVEDQPQTWAELSTARSFEQLFVLLAKRRVDVVLSERWNGHWWVKKLGMTVGVTRMPQFSQPMYIYLHERHRDLVSAMARALRAMKGDGTYARIFLKTLAPLETLRP